MATTATTITPNNAHHEKKPTLSDNNTNNNTKSSPALSKHDSVMSNASSSASSSAGNKNVRVLALHEWREAALSLAEAFKVDDVSMYFIDTPDRKHWSEEQKWQLHLRIMEFITYAHLLKGLVVCAGPNYDCVGLWMPPGKNMDDLWTILRSGMWRLNYLFSKEGRTRFFTEFLPLLNKAKLETMKERDDDSYYLVYLGTRPSGRGKGYARGVVEYVTSRADAENRACYLESSHHVNRQIYQKMGFELRTNIWLERAEEKVEMDIMVREPVVKHVGGKGA